MASRIVSVSLLLAIMGATFLSPSRASECGSPYRVLSTDLGRHYLLPPSFAAGSDPRIEVRKVRPSLNLPDGKQVIGKAFLVETKQRSVRVTLLRRKLAPHLEWKPPYREADLQMLEKAAEGDLPELLRLLYGWEERSELLPGASDVIRSRVMGIIPAALSRPPGSRMRHPEQSASAPRQRVIADLAPSVRLRLDTNLGQFPLDGTDEPHPQGFGLAGQAHLEISRRIRNGQPVLSLDPFLAQLFASGTYPLPQPAPAEGARVVAHPVEITGQRYLRLVLPSYWVPSGEPAGPAGLFRLPLIIGANTWNDLEEATRQVIEGASWSGIKDATLTVFRGRAFLVPEIQIVRRGGLREVAMGTTVGDLVQSQRLLTGREMRDRVRLKRPFGSDFREVRFESDHPAAFDLTLNPGDRLEW